jgi:hypothetical protein
MERGLNELVQRHEALRTTFASDEGRPFQVISSASPVPLPVIDLQQVPEAEREARMRSASPRSPSTRSSSSPGRSCAPNCSSSAPRITC